MASRDTVTMGNGQKMALWVRVDTLNKKGFGKGVEQLLDNVEHSKMRKHLVRRTSTYVIMSPSLFEYMQAQFDLVPRSFISLYGQQRGKQPTALRDAVNCPMQGKDKSGYDRILRFIRL